MFNPFLLGKIFLFGLLNSQSPLQNFTEFKNISYISPSDSSYHSDKHLLDIYAPQTKKSSKVLIFIHGGSWKSGSKNTYGFYGKRFAERGIVTVVINYRLENATYSDMASDCANAVKWVRQNIAQYGGEPESIFLSGHSAGGHLSALIATDSTYLQSPEGESPVKGVIQIDGFGFDMENYLLADPSDYAHSLYPIFSSDRENWRKSSPIQYINKSSPPFLILTGGKSYHFVKVDNTRFKKSLTEREIPYEWEHLPKETHFEMIAKFYFRKNPLIERILVFMQE